MSRIEQALAKGRAAGGPALVTYVTGGDPDLSTSAAIVRAIARAGADVVEVGVPFSDPIADGPAIQRASERALAAGSHLGATLDLVADVRSDTDVPIVLFTYVNPVMRLGVDRFIDRAAAVGVDGVLLLDLPIEEAENMKRGLDARGIDQIFLVSPTTTDERLRVAGQFGRGFLYAISRLGVTGVRDAVAGSAAPLVERIRAVTTLPIALGFGLSRPEHVREVSGFADAAVVGSVLVDAIARAALEHRDVPAAAGQLVHWLKHG